MYRCPVRVEIDVLSRKSSLSKTFSELDLFYYWQINHLKIMFAKKLRKLELAPDYVEDVLKKYS
jgi:hypothetical protein